LTVVDSKAISGARTFHPAYPMIKILQSPDAYFAREFLNELQGGNRLRRPQFASAEM